jgi:sodium-dependent dicarboxylate transporter 2/3/5
MNVHGPGDMAPGLPSAPQAYVLARGPAARIDWKRLICLLLGLALFFAIYLAPSPSDAVDPSGRHFALSHEGKAALALFVMAAVWWIFEVVPIGVTGIAIGVIQTLFLIRPPRDAFGDFMHPAIWFVIGSVAIGLSFTRTGLTKRMAYKMLSLAGENTAMILLVSFVMTAALTHVMAHTAVAASLFPLLMAVYGLYTDETKPTRFGKALFIGVAYVAGAGSIITLLGSARAAVAIGFFHDMTGIDVSFLKLSWYLFPIGWLMVFLLWGFFMLFYRPEQKSIPGLHERVRALNIKLGPITRAEIIAISIVALTIIGLSLRTFAPVFAPFDKSGIILLGIILLFVFRVLDLEDLQKIPWNMILLFGGAMSIGLCLWQTGASHWLAISLLGSASSETGLLFVLGVALVVMLLTNFVINLATIALCLPVALVMAPYYGVSTEVVMFASLVAAGMPFLLLIGAAPNAIAYESKQFTAGEFFLIGIPASVILIAVLALFVWLIWPMMGMAVTAG